MSDTPEARTNFAQVDSAAKGNLEARPRTVYQPDKENMAFTMSFFLHPNLKNYEGFRELSDAGKEFR